MTANPWTPSDRLFEPATPGKPVIHPAAWNAAEMARGEAWVYRLAERENNEIVDAVRRIEAVAADIRDVGPNDFGLPRFSAVLGDIKNELMRGRGFALLRGVDLDALSKDQAAKAFWGLGAYLGTAIPQNGRGNVIDHVKDQGGAFFKDRGYTTTAALGFHCDSCDILGLGCVQPGKAGGEHRISPSVSVYNTILERRPDLADALCQFFDRYRAGDGFGVGKPWISQRVFSFHEGHFTCRSAGAIAKAQSLPEVPKHGPLQIEALKFFDEVANELALSIDFERGDFFYVMNHTVMHSRRAYEDWPEPERKRHLLRLWLTNHQWPLPREIEETMDGVPVPDGARHAPLDVTVAA